MSRELPLQSALIGDYVYLKGTDLITFLAAENVRAETLAALCTEIRRVHREAS